VKDVLPIGGSTELKGIIESLLGWPSFKNFHAKDNSETNVSKFKHQIGVSPLGLVSGLRDRRPPVHL
jgi:hypothetical protein